MSATGFLNTALTRIAVPPPNIMTLSPFDIGVTPNQVPWRHFDNNACPLRSCLCPFGSSQDLRSWCNRIMCELCPHYHPVWRLSISSNGPSAYHDAILPGQSLKWWCLHLKIAFGVALHANAQCQKLHIKWPVTSPIKQLPCRSYDGANRLS